MNSQFNFWKKYEYEHEHELYVSGAPGADTEIHVVLHRGHLVTQTQAHAGSDTLAVLELPGVADAPPGVRIPADAHPDPGAPAPRSTQAGAPPVLLHIW